MSGRGSSSSKGAGPPTSDPPPEERVVGRRAGLRKRFLPRLSSPPPHPPPPRPSEGSTSSSSSSSSPSSRPPVLKAVGLINNNHHQEDEDDEDSDSTLPYYCEEMEKPPPPSLRLTMAAGTSSSSSLVVAANNGGASGSVTPNPVLADSDLFIKIVRTKKKAKMVLDNFGEGAGLLPSEPAAKKALENPVIVQNIIHFFGKHKLARLVHPVWNDVVLSSSKPRLRLKLPRFLGNNNLVPVRDLIVKSDERLGRHIFIREPDTSSPTELTDLQISSAVQIQLSITLHTYNDTIQSLQLYLIQYDTLYMACTLLKELVPNLKILCMILDCEHAPEEKFHGAFTADKLKIRKKHSLQEIHFRFGQHPTIPTAPALKVAKGFMERILAAAPNLLDLCCTANIQPNLSKNTKLKKLAHAITFSNMELGRHNPFADNFDEETEHYESVKEYGGIDSVARMLGQVSKTLEVLELRAVQMDSRCGTCQGMVNRFNFPRLPVLKSLTVFNPDCFWLGDGLENVGISTCPRLEHLQIDGPERSFTVDFQNNLGKLWRKRKHFGGPLDSFYVKTIPNGRWVCASGGSSSSSGGLSSLTLGSVSCANVVHMQKDPFPSLRRLEFIMTDCRIPVELEAQRDPSLVAQNPTIQGMMSALVACASLGLAELHITFSFEFKLSAFITAIVGSSILSSAGLQKLTLANGATPSNLVINDVVLTKSRPTYIKNFETCLRETSRMKEVKFVNLTMDGEMAQAIMSSITTRNLPVTFLQHYPNTR